MPRLINDNEKHSLAAVWFQVHLTVLLTYELASPATFLSSSAFRFAHFTLRRMVPSPKQKDKANIYDSRLKTVKLSLVVDIKIPSGQRNIFCVFTKAIYEVNITFTR